MDFNSADLGNSRLSEFTDVTDLKMTFEADEGDSVLSLAQALGDLRLELLDAAGKKVKPVSSSLRAAEKGKNVFACAFLITRKGVYRLRVFANKAAVTVIKFGRDILKYARRTGPPTRGTCSFCRKTLMLVMLLASHGLVIPAGHTVLASLLAHYKKAATMLMTLREYLPDSIVDFITPAVETIFKDAKRIQRIPRYLLDPLGETAKYVCKGLNWCSAQTQ